ncbi:hypothetical protein CH373_06805 [Leptospira perolatii]|uniref:DUF4842 domain-containing protein n=1 Tax=Leptospira perolatii TaxID=2023191 RepID=A0A2M9ZP93_9LEPT|nr:LruC domain-containing protein [Leptospira perolatii]PJZ70643.1 hypothetical protein CH360_03665 [Leptospira perolatii]PJZ73854.1 hypothetical protein CH373_06805 [Leptospira perolatii]
MNRILLLAFIASLTFQCNHKKKGMFLLPFLDLVNTNSTGSSSGTSGNTGSSGVVFVPGDGNGNPAPGVEVPTNSTDNSNSGNSGTTSPSGSTSNSGGGSEASNSNSGGDNTTSSGGGSGSPGTSSGTEPSSDNSNSGNTSSGGSDEVASGNESDSGSETPADTGTGNTQPPASDVVAVVVVDDPKGEPDFNYNTTQNIPLNLTVVNNQDQTVSGATVLVYDENSNLLFQGVSDSNGKVTGILTVPTSVGNITVDISIGGDSISQYIDLTNVLGINRTIRYEINLPANQVADSDNDGVPNSTDIYPDDPTRSTELLYPSEGVYTIAFEDQYPTPGDADLNDYVIQFKNQEDLNASGKIVRLRGTYAHVAKGAGYRHKLYVRLPVGTGASVTYKLTQASGKVEEEKTVQVTANDLATGFEIFPDSNTTIRNQNVHPGDVFKPGFTATVEFVFNSPVARTSIGAFPYDLYAYVINTKQNIHLPGLFKNADGSDPYLDKTGFPWAILIPGAWKYPYEHKDIRKPSETGYSEFALWAASNGKEYKEWYNHISNDSLVFPVPDPAGLLGYLYLSVKHYALIYAVGLLLAAGAALYILKRKHLIRA